jgi:hypothetical protein
MGLFWNRGGKKFEFGGELGTTARMYRWLAVADFNQDGCPDVVVTALNAPAMLIENRCK